MSDMITVTLPDGSQKQTARGTTIADFVRDGIGAGLAKAALFARVNGQDVDLARPLTEDVKLQVFTTKSPEALDPSATTPRTWSPAPCSASSRAPR
jgi:threonyl-tRNA synthetase